MRSMRMNGASKNRDCPGQNVWFIDYVEIVVIFGTFGMYLGIPMVCIPIICTTIFFDDFFLTDFFWQIVWRVF